MQSFQTVLFIAISVAMFVICVVGKDCEKRDRCNCVFDDNSGMIDIWSLARTDGVPLFYDQPSAQDSYLYSYNPCYGFSEGSCVDVAVCQFDYMYYGFYDLGTVDTVDFSYDGLNVIATYTSADGSRKTYVTLVCDPSATTARADILGESGFLSYYMTVTAAAACPIAAPFSSQLSGGSVLLIIFFVLLAVYLIVGVSFNKFKRQATGTDLIPNRDFWLLFPRLVKDGCAFVAGLFCRGRKTVYTSM